MPARGWSWLCVLAVLYSLSHPVYSQQQRHVLSRHLPLAVSSGQAKPEGLLPATQRMNLSIVLPIRNRAQLTSLLSQIYDPESPDYRHYLSVAEFTERFGPSEHDYQQVVDFAKSNGLTVTGAHANRLLVPVSGTVDQIQRAFNVQMKLYQHPTEARKFFSTDREPSVPSALCIGHIGGLNNYFIPKPMLTQRQAIAVSDATAQGSGPGGSYLPSDMRAAYYGAGSLTGRGQTVALLELYGYDINDVVANFAGAASATANADGSGYVLNYVPQPGGTTYTVPINNVLLDNASSGLGFGGDAEEVTDISQVIGMAPGISQVRVYIGGYLDDLNAIASENIARQVSISWQWAPEDSYSDDVLFQEMAAQGQTVFVASGDYGAYNILNSYYFPSEDDYVTAVGGTTLTTDGAAGAWVSETAWQASGGGVSPDLFPIPWWQAGVSTQANAGSTIYRNVPDVAMEAGNDNYSCARGTCSEGYGGTSFAAPRWAGYMALANQQAASQGQPPIGFLNPLIYSIGQAPSYSTAFHDIVVGTNSDNNTREQFYYAVPGYDLVTGWGSPAGDSLIGTLLQTSAGSGFQLSFAPASLKIVPGGSATTTIAINPMNGFSGPVTLSNPALPQGVKAFFSQNPVTTSSVMTVSVDPNTPRGTYLLTVSGSANGQSTTAYFALFVEGSGIYVMPDPAFLPVVTAPGFASSTMMGLWDFSDPTGNFSGMFTGTATLAIDSALPSGVTAVVNPIQVTGQPSAVSSNITFIADDTAPTWQGSVNLSATSQGKIGSHTINLDVSAPFYNLAVSPIESNLVQGGSIKMTVSASPVGNFSGTINLLVGNSGGLSATFNPASITVGQTSTLTLTASPSATLGAGYFIINGQSGNTNIFYGIPFTVTSSPVPSFSITPESSYLVLPQGGSTTNKLTVNDENGFSDFVQIPTDSVYGLTTTVAPTNNTTGTSTVTYNTTSLTLPTKDYIHDTITVGSVTAQVGYWVLVTPTVPFTLGTQTGTLVLPLGGSGFTTISIAPQNGYSGSVALSTSGLPDGINATFDADTTTTDTILRLNADSSVQAGTYYVNVTGTADGQSLTRTIPIQVGTQTSSLAPPPTFSPGPGTYSTPTKVKISDYLTAATIYYTTDGTTPTTNSPIYNGPITVSTTQTIKAIATASGYANSNIGSASYNIAPQAAMPAFSLRSGAYTSMQTVTLSSSTPGAIIYYTTDGSTPGTGSTLYKNQISVSASETIQAIATASGYANSEISSATYTLAQPAAIPVFNLTPGTYTSAQTVSISDSTPGAVIYYTTNGSTPTTSSTLYSGPITVSASETIEAIAIASGYSQSAVASATYTINLPKPAPTITSLSPAYTAAAGSAFTLTVNGSGFIAGSTVYWGNTALSTAFVSTTQLTAQVPASDIASAGITAITVMTPAPDGTTSGKFQFEVDSANSGLTAPTFTTASATLSAGGTASYPVTVPSSVSGVSINCLNLPTGASCSYSASLGTVSISTTAATPPGSYRVTVVFSETVSSSAAYLLAPFLLLPFMFLRRKLFGSGFWITSCLVLVLTLGAVAAIGCGGGGAATSQPVQPAPTQITSSGAVTLTIH